MQTSCHAKALERHAGLKSGLEKAGGFNLYGAWSQGFLCSLLQKSRRAKALTGVSWWLIRSRHEVKASFVPCCRHHTGARP
eukprot:1157036-Pelagomonas_calceolata.AAC.2